MSVHEGVLFPGAGWAISPVKFTMINRAAVRPGRSYSPPNELQKWRNGSAHYVTEEANEFVFTSFPEGDCGCENGCSSFHCGNRAELYTHAKYLYLKTSHQFLEIRLGFWAGLV